ncbi:molybdopterin-dependent oxidoreductase [Tengunoibacter tsumagoiensis]|uniref:Molybdopterin-binding oxidoreductase n=1 Tax=Tengunoibacter tsumagoiensis TaxID=2014871 RepID=A0A401ZVJ9_9CHLR|nr:molybdopterin-dependent oxidoreductase [Tengunoibacter tsumagoiensis]GCE10948.1 hypothetical protein KTT_08070 [Tengunoibacter tsumagoiensis]
MNITPYTRRDHFRLGFQAGLGAGICATILMLVLSQTLGSISLAEALGSTIAQSMPLSLFEYLHRTIGGDAKHYLFYIILVGQCLVFALFGGLCTLLVQSINLPKAQDQRGRLTILTGLLLAALLWLLTGLVFLPLTQAGIFGSELTIGANNTMISLAVVGIVFGLIYIFLQNWLIEHEAPNKPDPQAAQTASRRALLRNGLIVIGVGVVGVAAWRFITGGTGSFFSSSKLVQNYKNKISPVPQPDYTDFTSVPNLSSEVTSNGEFYTVSKNLFSDPTVDGNSWQLTVDGAVSSPYTLNYSQLMALPMKQQPETLMCISNDVGGQYMGNAVWDGIVLEDLLKKAGTLKPGATKVVLHAADNYTDSIHLSKALEPTTVVAVKMNRKTLPQNHGYPARLLVPGIYGMKHVKWITRIEVVDTDYKGYWQQNGWSDPAPIRMTSRIDTPGSGISIKADKPTYVAGVAFSGNKGISEVDVSFDQGSTWQPAMLKKPLSELTWVLWELPWQPKAGTYTIIVRAIDKEGNVQDPQEAPPQPDGSSGYHSVSVTVA